MSRLWDTPEFWARSEADEMLREMADADPAALADSFERNPGSYDDDPDLAAAIIAELRRRSAAGVRFWSGPRAVDAAVHGEREEKARKEKGASLPGESAPITEADIPW